MNVGIGQITRTQRARIYAVALAETGADFALESAVIAARRLGLLPGEAAQLGRSAVQYAIACHGLVDTTAAEIAVRVLNRGIIPRPNAIIRQARAQDRRIERATRHNLARRLMQDEPAGLGADR